MTNQPFSLRRPDWPSTHAAAVFVILCFYLVCPVAPLRWADLYHAYGKILIISAAAVYFYKAGLGSRVEARLVVYYAVWMFVSRLLNTDLYLQNELDLVISRFLCAVVLPTGLLLDPAARRRLLDWVVAVYCGFFCVAALFGLFCCLTGSYLYIPPENAAFGIETYWQYKYINYLCLFTTNRTISALWLYLAWALMTYEFFRCRSKLWRIPIALAWLVFFLAVSLSFTRTVKFALSINVSMLVLLWGLKLLDGRRNALKIPVLALAMAASLLLAYGAQELAKDGVAVLSAHTVSSMSREDGTRLHFHPLIDEEYGDTVVDFTDPRDTAESLSNLSSRSEIYASFLPTLRADPIRILRGCYSNKVMDIPNTMLSIPFFHMHNFLLQVFMLTGLPGFLLVLVFSVLLVRRMILLFFSRSAPLCEKLLTLPLTGMFFYSLFETLIFTDSADARSLTTDIRELMFFLLAGIVLAYSYEYFPAKRNNKRNK